ncbi:hypothetical protein MF1_04990 [Bartonella quintana]|nr:hypothetical protein MF1_04990 [Bartonella quintana]
MLKLEKGTGNICQRVKKYQSYKTVLRDNLAVATAKKALRSQRPTHTKYID